MLENKVISITFLISVVGHLLFLGLPAEFKSSPSLPEKSRDLVVQIEVERPTLLPRIEKMGQEKKLISEASSQPPKASLAKGGKPATREETQPPSEKDEAIEGVVLEQELKLDRNPEGIRREEPKERTTLAKERIGVIDPAQEAMLRYQDLVKQRIERVRRYPLWAKRQGFEGAVGLRFVILSSGYTRGAEVVRSSGFKILDQEAITTITRASPFPPLPSELGQDLASVEVTIVFKLK